MTLQNGKKLIGFNEKMPRTHSQVWKIFHAETICTIWASRSRLVFDGELMEHEKLQAQIVSRVEYAMTIWANILHIWSQLRARSLWLPGRAAALSAASTFLGVLFFFSRFCPTVLAVHTARLSLRSSNNAYFLPLIFLPRKTNPGNERGARHWTFGFVPPHIRQNFYTTDHGRLQSGKYCCWLLIRRTPRDSRAIFVVGRTQMKKLEIWFFKVQPSCQFYTIKSRRNFRRTKVLLMEWSSLGRHFPRWSS
jgi:hypothetical protein